MKPTDPFEELLARQPLQPPPAWLRANILRQARPPQPRTLAELVRDWLWPHPVAWGALALAWIAVVTLSYPIFVSGPEGPALAQRAPASSPAVSAQLREQRALLHSLLDVAPEEAVPTEPRPGAHLRRREPPVCFA
jgi:hypothetical protein